MSNFLSIQPKSEDYWRGIILMGRNVASYKLALAKALLELSSDGKTFVSMEELALPYTRHLTEHLKLSEKQITSKSSRFLDACQRFNDGNLSQSELVDSAVNLGFHNVIDAFHRLNQGEIPHRFYIDERKSRKGITLTDELLNLAISNQASNLPHEVEARWRLLETAWALSLPPKSLSLQFDSAMEYLFIEVPSDRIGVTGCREALNGYQKGKCFYCFDEVLIDEGGKSQVDVDHFFPIVLAQYPEFKTINLNGIWNLVLACTNCNRGFDGKFARIPSIRLLERLHTRNQFYIESHHPLRESLINQTGINETSRRKYLQQVYNQAKLRLLTEWNPRYEHQQAF